MVAGRSENYWITAALRKLLASACAASEKRMSGRAYGWTRAANIGMAESSRFCGGMILWGSGGTLSHGWEFGEAEHILRNKI